MSEGKRRLLLIDDDPDFVAGITPILRDAGYEVDVAYTPPDGFERLRKGDYDLLLLDLIMGRGAEGVMLARKLRKDPKLASLPVLVVTGIREQMNFLFSGQAPNARFMPVDDLLEKPIEPQVLLDKVSTLLRARSEKRAQAEAVL